MDLGSLSSRAMPSSVRLPAGKLRPEKQQLFAQSAVVGAEFKTPDIAPANKTARDLRMRATSRKGIRLLSICDDDGIRFSRELVLMQEGYEVESVASSAQLDGSYVRSFHIAILCHSLNPKRAAKITEGLRQRNPSIAVLRVHAMRSRLDPYYDVDCEVLPGPDELLDAIRSLVPRFESRGEMHERRLA